MSKPVFIALLAGVGFWVLFFYVLPDEEGTEQARPASSTKSSSTEAPEKRRARIEREKKYAEAERQEVEKKAEASARINALVMCEQFIEEQLKAPSTAKFVRDGRAISQDPDDQSVWRVRGKVDSQNLFGAMIRWTYTCKLKRIGGGNWYALELTVE